MGRRGGKRRRRKNLTETDKDFTLTERDTSSSKRPKLSTDDEDETSKTNIEVSYHGQGELTIPRPLNLDDRATYTQYDELSFLWNYIGGKKEWKPSKIQKQVWPILLQKDDRRTLKHNIIGIAPTGSGKTLAYGIPTLLSKKSILILVPTRELVQQVSKIYSKLIKGYEKKTGIPSIFHVASIHGGVDRKNQKKELSKMEQKTLIIVSTPGRLLDLLQDEDTNAPNNLGWIVLDEADQLAKDGDLGPQVEQIMNLVRTDYTRLCLVSATYPETARTKFQSWVGNEYVLLQVDQLSHTSTKGALKDSSKPSSRNLFARIPDHLNQVLHVCSEHKKPRKLLTTLQNIKKENTNRNSPLGIVFFSRIEKVKYISKLLEKEGIPSLELHSQLSSLGRTNNLQTFQSGKRPLLLATDVAARGIDIPSVNFVIQYDFPGNLQQYIHRCGRAGRSGNAATVYSFFTRNLKPLAADMIQLLESTNAWVDPNLRELVKGGGMNNGTNKKARKKSPTKQQPKQTSLVKHVTSMESIGSDEDDDFPELVANRIVLKRASHVSDASSSSSSEEEEEE